MALEEGLAATLEVDRKWVQVWQELVILSFYFMVTLIIKSLQTLTSVFNASVDMGQLGVGKMSALVVKLIINFTFSKYDLVQSLHHSTLRAPYIFLVKTHMHILPY